MRDPHAELQCERIRLYGAVCAFGARELAQATLDVVEAKIGLIHDHGAITATVPVENTIDLTEHLVMPGFINAHDHLQFALYPRLADSPYRNYVEWGEDIHRRHASVIARQHQVSRQVRLWWGGLRNLLCGVTTVCHHDPLWPALGQAGFPVRVLQRYGWAHSVALGVEIRSRYLQTPRSDPFIVHACEGVDSFARQEIADLDAMDVLHDNTILVHGLALCERGIARVKESGASLILCPSSNLNLFGELPDVDKLREIGSLALGSDSPLTSFGDLLDELQFVLRYCGISGEEAYRMVTEAPAKMLRLPCGTATIAEGAPADLIAVRHTGQVAADRLKTLSMVDIELVIIGGRIQLCSEKLAERIPARLKRGLNPIFVGGVARWLRASVSELLSNAEEALGSHEVSLSGRRIAVPSVVGT